MWTWAGTPWWTTSHRASRRKLACSDDTLHSCLFNVAKPIFALSFYHTLCMPLLLTYHFSRRIKVDGLMGSSSVLYAQSVGYLPEHPQAIFLHAWTSKHWPHTPTCTFWFLSGVVSMTPLTSACCSLTFSAAVIPIKLVVGTAIYWLSQLAQLHILPNVLPMLGPSYGTSSPLRSGKKENAIALSQWLLPFCLPDK